MTKKIKNNSIGMYIHIPFCAKKCPYCDFYSVDYRKPTAELYKNAVIRNIGNYAKQQKISIDTVYFGGGTPSLFPIEYISEIIKEIHNKFKVLEDSEITLEVNPMTINLNKLKQLKEAGITRLSIGVQSCVDSELISLGRKHSYKQAEKTVLEAREAGFENISCDLMIGTAGQTVESLKYSLETLSHLPIKHISAYILKIEENTPYSESDIISRLPSEDLTADFYLEMVSNLQKNGFHQYEISNFAKEGFESQHNLKYWHCEEYIGIGSASHSFYNGKRYAVPRDIENFINSPNQTEEITELSPADFFEIAMLQLRLTEGLDMKLYPKEYDRVLKNAVLLERTELIKISDDIISLTPAGFLVSNSIIEKLILE